MRASAKGATDVGRRRTNNEDAFVLLEDAGIYGVADGVGGQNAGEVASRIFVDTVRAEAPRFGELKQRAGDQPDRMREAFLGYVSEVLQKASGAIYEAQKANRGLRGMASTGVLFCALDGWGVLGHVGDSRAYLVRRGQARQLTVDHSITQEMLDAGTLKREDIPGFAFRGVLSRSLGQLPKCRPDTLWLDVHAGDRIVLCSDGLSQYFEPAEIARITSGSVEDAIAAANAAGGVDNVTAVLVDVQGNPTRSIEVDTEGRMRVLAGLFLFRSLSPAEQLRALKIVREERFDAGATLVRENEAGDRLYAVVSGSLAVIKGGVTLTELNAGDHFGELSFVDARPRSATVVARTASTVLVVSRDDFDVLAREEPATGVKVLRSLAAGMSERLRHISEDFVARAR